MSRSVETSIPHGIAVVGMAGRFPGARTVEKFWENLRAGVESITFFTDEELLAAGIAPALLRDPNYVKAKAVLEDVELFDAAFFGFTPREAELLDPQHRILLECAWEALEDAGYDPEVYPGRAAVYAGSGTGLYLLSNLLPNAELMERVGALQAILLNDRDFLSTRLSYKLDLKGPSVLVQTACSTGLVAIHMGCQALLAGEADLALAGGVSVNVPMIDGYLFQEGGISSPDGHCRAFDAAAAGSVSGSGAGLVVLKRLDDALAAGDRIYAVVRGSAVNNDGAGKMGFTAPSIEGQAEVITEALLMADVPPDSVAMVEGHGSGTPLGDPIEISALVQAFRGAGAEGVGYCALGSIKTNVGHLNTAAGVAGFIKAVLALRHGLIPPSLHFERPNPQADLEGSPFYVPTRATAWPEALAPRRAGVSSFGLGGTNAHVVLEEAPAPEPSGPSRPWQLLLVSARTGTAREAATANLARRLEASLEAGEDLDLADVAFTLHAGRKAFEHRRALVCRDRQDAVAALCALDPSRVATGEHAGGARPVAFLFPGLGDHYPGMARELYETEPTFAAEIDRAAGLLQDHLEVDIREVLFSSQGDGQGEDASQPAGPGRQADLRALLRRGSGSAPAGRPVDRTELAQPVLFAVEHALARLLIEWGIRPQAMIGYSVGEYVAACLSGVLSLEDALGLVARRAKFIQELPAGAMLAVPLPEAEVTPQLGDDLSLSATNGPHLSVVGGPEQAVADLERRLSERGVACLRLTTTHAFHSRMLEPAVGALTGLARSLPRGEPAIPYLSNVTGTWITAADLGDPGYWARHMVQPVRFAEGLSELLREPELVLLEVGPGSTLTTLVRQHPDSAGRVAISTLRRESERGSDVGVLLEAVGRLWTAGVPLDPEGFFSHQRRRRVALPTYPFERRRCWIDPPSPAGAQRPSQDRLDAGSEASFRDGEAADLADWFYLPGWRRTAPPARAAEPAEGSWLVFADRSGMGGRLVERLRRQGREVVTVTAGEPGAGLVQDEATDRYVLDPGRRDAYGELVTRLRARGAVPRRVVHLWTLDPVLEPLPFGLSQEAGLLCVLFLAQALSEAGIADPLHLTVVSSRLQQVVDGEPIEPEKAPLLAALKVLPQEYPHWTCRSVDVIAPPPGPAAEQLAERLLAEAEAPGRDFAVAWRGRDRWVRAFDRVRLDEVRAPGGVGLRNAGTYLVTDGVHGIGPALAEQLLRRFGARLAVVVPPGFPERGDWERLAAAGQPGDAALEAVRRLLTMEGLGGEIWAVAADLADSAQVSALLDRVRERYGALHGVFHTATATAGGLVQLKTAESLISDLAPQVEGARRLRELLRGQPVDFLLLCSSTLAVTGGFGQLESAAAGAFVDALALGEDGPATFAVHWDPYQWDGWLAAGVGGGPLLSQEDLQKNLEVYGIPAVQSAEALVRLLAAELPRVVVSARDLGAQIRQAEEITAATLMEQMEQARRTAPKHARQLATPYVAPGNDLEAEIAAAWEDLFGIAPIGIHDSFLELGGHSLLAIQVTTELRKRYEVDLPVTAVFESPTVAELAAAIARAREEEEMQLEELLAAVEGLSPDETLRRMQEEIGTHA